MDPAGAALYISDSGNACVRRVNISANSSTYGYISTVAGVCTLPSYTSGVGDGGQGTVARLNTPAQIAVSPDGAALYIVDEGNSNVRVLSLLTGVITSVLAGSAYPFSAPAGVAVGAAGLYVSNQDTCTVVYVPFGASASLVVGYPYRCGYKGDGGPGLGARLRCPGALTLTPTALLIVDPCSNVVRSWSPVTKRIATVVGGLYVYIPQTDGTTSTYTTTYSTSTTTTYTSGGSSSGSSSSSTTSLFNDGGYLGDGGLATLAQLNSPFHAVLTEGGTLYVTDRLNSAVRMVVPPTPTPTRTSTRSVSGTRTRTVSGTATRSGSRSATQSRAASVTATGTRTPSKSAAVSKTPSKSAAVTKSVTQTRTKTR